MKKYLLGLSLLVGLHATLLPESESRSRKRSRRSSRAESGQRTSGKQSRTKRLKRSHLASSGAVITINSQQEYNDAIASGNVVVKFYKVGCGHCKHFAPIFADAAQKYSNVKFIQVDCEGPASNLCAQYVERGYPTTLFYKDGQKIDDEVGAMETGDLEAKLDSHYK